MKASRSMSIRSKLLVITGTVLLIMLGYSTISILSSGDDKERLLNVVAQQSRQAKVQSLQLLVSHIWQFITDASLTRDPSVMAQEAKPALEAAKVLVTELAGLEGHPEDKAEIEALGADLDAQWDLGQAMYEAYARSADEGNAAMEAFDSAGQAILTRLDSVVKTQEDDSATLVATVLRQNEYQTIFLILLTVVLATIVLSVGLVTAVRMPKAIRLVGAKLGELANDSGNLSIQLPVQGEKEAAELATNFNAFTSRLKSILVNIQEVIEHNRVLSDHISTSARVTAESISDLIENVGTIEFQVNSLDSDIEGSSNAVQEITQSFQNLSDLVDKQMEAVQRSSAAIEEIMASINSVARISEARTAAIRTLVELIESGARKVSTTNANIAEVARSTEAILGLTALINDIAAQTNLLAMNAAIEAAHAGDAGRGFAVVASEIRKLAEGTSSNAARITQTLKGSTERIHQASISGSESQEALQVINREVNEFASALEEVTTSMAELSNASTEILDSIGTMVDTSEKVSKATTAMRSSTDEVNGAIAHIKAVSTNTLDVVQRTFANTESLSRVSMQVAAYTNQNRYNTFLLASESSSIHTGIEARGEEVVINPGLDWNDILSVGLTAMDDEHKELFKRINSLIASLLEGSLGSRKLGEIITFIQEYVDHHFSHEEQEMAAMGYPGLAEHQKIHESFKSNFASLAHRLRETGFNAQMLIHLQDTVVNWLLDHIAKVDRKYGDFFEARQSRDAT